MKNRGFEICSKYLHEELIRPIRKTKNSVGYDFYSATDMIIPSIWKSIFSFFKGEKVEIKPTLIPTGFKAYFNEDEFLILANKSSFPLKKGLIMGNSIGIVESDYYNNESNEGELFFQYFNIFPTDLKISKGDCIGQAYFQKFLVTDDDNNTNAIRKGGFGSTNKL